MPIRSADENYQPKCLWHPRFKVRHPVFGAGLASVRVWVVREGMGYYDEQVKPAVWIVFTVTVRCGLLPQDSHVAPSPQRRILCERHETGLTYCPVYGFKPRVA